MRSQSSLVASIFATALSAGAVGCSTSQSATTATTDSSAKTEDTGGSPALGSGGSSAISSGGEMGKGGTTGSGGTTGTGGGLTGTGGTLGSGGTSTVVSKPSSGGASGAGGTLATGGTSSIDGGATSGFPAKFVGNIDTRGSIRSDFSTYWNQFSPENAGKWGSVQSSSQGSFNWSSLDAMYKYCNDHNIVFKQHNFIWGAQQPGWTSSLTTSTGPAAVQNWMKTFCDRYPNTKIIDVVNEPPPHTTPSYANAIGGGTNSTWDWIANAFKWAHDACPNAILVLNDYNNDEQSGDAQHSIDIVTAIKKLGAPIDAIGCQTHGALSASSSTLKTNIDKMATATGLGVYITEYDINTSDDNKQKQQYQDHFTMFMSNANIKGVTVWGYIQGATWETNSGIMSDSGTQRPAMTWLMSFLNR
jgi:endo-1,4-beta-xylanase